MQLYSSFDILGTLTETRKWTTNEFENSYLCQVPALKFSLIDLGYIFIATENTLSVVCVCSKLLTNGYC